MTARKIAAECGAYVNMNGVLFNTNVEFTAFVARIRAEAMEEAEKDAKRYQWLRDFSEPGICAFYMSVGQAFKGVRFTRETVDAAIDEQIAAAIRAQEGKPG